MILVAVGAITTQKVVRYNEEDRVIIEEEERKRSTLHPQRNKDEE